MWKDFFYFSKREKQGIIVLAGLIVAVTLLNLFYETLHKEETADDVSTTFDAEYADFIGSLKNIERKESRKEYASSRSAKWAKEVPTLFTFDPNTSDSIAFRTLGLRPHLIRSILNYRQQGGKFRTAEDFKKMYLLSEEQYTELYPYISIDERFSKRDTIRLLTTIADSTRVAFKYAEGTTIDLNLSDSIELMKIPGIGSGIAKRIIGYRERLGGYIHVSQLAEIDLDTTILSTWFTIEEATIPTQINLNKASIERMRRHPYFNFYQAKAIVEHRKKNGTLKSLKQLALYEEFTEEDFRRIAPYVCF